MLERIPLLSALRPVTTMIVLHWRFTCGDRRRAPSIRGPADQWPYLDDVLTGLCPVEVGRIAGQNDNGPGRIRLHFIAVELIAQADIENAGHDCVDPVLRVPVWHQLHAGGHFDPDHVGARL